MSWNYRVIHQQIKGEEYYAIHEVYYSRPGGRIEGWTSDAVTPSGESVEELERDLWHYRLALEKPVLEMATLQREAKRKKKA